MAENAFKADWPSFALGFNTGKSKGGGTPEGFHMVRFFNDDRTTLLYTVFVPTGANAIYAGDTPISTAGGVVFLGFEPSAANVTADLDCYATYESVGTLDESSWAAISAVSEQGIAQNYFAVGDTKMIRVEGQIGTNAINSDYAVYILGFDHNEELEGKGIHFGTFKTSDGVDVCFIDGKYYSADYRGPKYFNMNHWGNYNYGGWSGCDLRFDILGSTNRQPSGYGASPSDGRIGYDPTESCTTLPVTNSLMAALPADLRAVMKPMTKYTDNSGNKSDIEATVTKTVEYLPLLAEFEIFGVKKFANQYEQNKQKQYDYFALGNSRIKYRYANTDQTAVWWVRSPHIANASNFVRVYLDGTSKADGASNSLGLAPIFKV